MKYLIKFVVLFLTWPLLLFVLSALSIMWLSLYCWGVRGDFYLPTEAVKSLAYCLWHFKAKVKHNEQG